MLGYTKLANIEKRMETKIQVREDENATTTHWAGERGDEGDRGGEMSVRGEMRGGEGEVVRVRGGNVRIEGKKE
jgi:hypothetical protein